MAAKTKPHPCSLSPHEETEDLFSDGYLRGYVAGYSAGALATKPDAYQQGILEGLRRLLTKTGDDE